MSSVSGLARPQRIAARHLATQAALLGLKHAPQLHYTQGSQRWEGINHRLDASHGKYPLHADCSSFVTWCLWNALHLGYGKPDIVNGTGWKAGYTGTLAQHGREVLHVKNVMRGDLVLYGPAPTFEHVAIVVGHKEGRPVVVSNGSEGGPYLLDYKYRPDANMIRRYV